MSSSYAVFCLKKKRMLLALTLNTHLLPLILFPYSTSPPPNLYTLSLHDALPISPPRRDRAAALQAQRPRRPRLRRHDLQRRPAPRLPADDPRRGAPPSRPQIGRAHV